MESKHTPGPWGYDYQERHVSDGRPRFVLRGPVGGKASPHDEPWLGDLNADAHSIHSTRPEDEQAMATERANARLIAAAPEMLEALRAISDACDLPDSSYTAVERSALARARAAIAKATGEGE